jgi:hypothetical protein
MITVINDGERELVFPQTILLWLLSLRASALGTASGWSIQQHKTA